MHMLPRQILCLITLFALTAMAAYGADEATEAAIRAFSHNPAGLMMHTYAGHRADMYAYSCDGRYLFTANENEITVREYPSWRVVKTFPFRGTEVVEPHPTRPEMLYFRPSRNVYPTHPESTFLLADWKTGRILAHVERPAHLRQQTIRAVPDPLVLLNTDSSESLRFGYLPQSSARFSDYALNDIGQGAAVPDEDDSYLLVTSMVPCIIDLKHLRCRALDLPEKLKKRDNTLPRDYASIMRMLPKSRRTGLGNRQAYISRNHFEGIFAGHGQVAFGSPAGYLFDWRIDNIDGAGSVYGGALQKELPMAVFSVAQYGHGNSPDDYRRVMATTDGVYFGPLYGPYYKLPEFKAEQTGQFRDMANVVAGPYGDGKFLVGMATAEPTDSPKLYAGCFRNGTLTASADNGAWGEILDIKISDDGTYALLTNGHSLRKADLTRSDTIRMQPIIRVPADNSSNHVVSCAILPGGRMAAGMSGGGIYIYTPASGNWEKLENSHSGKVLSMKLSANGTRLYTNDENSSIIIWDASTMERIVTINMLYPFGFIAITPDNYYTIQTLAPASSLINFSRNNRTYSFDQFDLIYNRPDIVAERLGGDAGYIALLHKAWLKRLRRNGLTPEHLASGFHTPEIEITERERLSAAVDSPAYILKIKASDTQLPLKSLHLKHNGVSLFGETGQELDSGTYTTDQSFTVQLVPGINNISVWAMNTEGASSVHEEITVNYNPSEPEPEPALWVVALGVSDYDNPGYRLRYAAKDARDFMNLLRTSCNSFPQVSTMCVTDKEFTADVLPAIKRFLSNARRNDAVVLFYAGHGVIDSELDYYLAPADMDFANPARKGISVNRLMELLSETPPMKRYMLIDACHSGTFEKEEYLAENTVALPAEGGLQFRGTGGMRRISEESRQANILSDKYFHDTGSAYGTTVLTASSGDEVALESDSWNNGLFTHLLIEGMTTDPLTGNPRAEFGGDVTFGSLADYISKRAPALSGERQHPTITPGGAPELTIYKTFPE